MTLPLPHIHFLGSPTPLLVPRLHHAPHIMFYTIYVPDVWYLLSGPCLVMACPSLPVRQQHTVPTQLTLKLKDMNDNMIVTTSMDDDLSRHDYLPAVGCTLLAGPGVSLCVHSW